MTIPPPDPRFGQPAERPFEWPEAREPAPMDASFAPSATPAEVPYAHSPAPARVRVNPGTMVGALTVAGMVLLLVAAVLALLVSLERIGDGSAVRTGANDATLQEGVIVLLVGGLALGCALMAWMGKHQLAGVLGIVAGVVLVVLWPETAGVLAVLGGVVLLVARYVPEPL